MVMPKKPISKMTNQEREEAVRDAVSVIRGDYYTDVKNMAQQIVDRAGEMFDDDELTQDALMRYMDESLDSDDRVFTTSKAIMGLLISNNDHAFYDAFGEAGMVEDGDIQWMDLMREAYRMDVYEELEREHDFDINNPEDEFEEDDEE